jgi:hypothetical protein
MSLEIIPYSVHDGIPTFKDSAILALYDQMVKDGTAKTVFIDGVVSSGEAFLNLMKNSVVAIAVKDGEPAGLGWLTNIELKRAQAHFCLFSKVWGNGSDIVGKRLLSYLSNLRKNGSYAFDCLIGFVPSRNTGAINFALQCGGHISGELPYAVYCSETDSSEPVTVVYYQRR